MKILSVATFAYPDHFGGAERVITEVATRLARRGHSVTLLTGAADPSPTRESLDGVDLVRYALKPPGSRGFYGSVWRGLRRAIDAGVGADADVLHLHQLASAIPAVMRGGATAPTRVLSFYAPYHLEYLARYREGRADGAVPLRARATSTVLRAADRFLVSRSDRILVLSEFSKHQVTDLDAAAGERTTVAPAGVDLDRFRPSRDGEVDDEIDGLPPGAGPLLVTVRRLVPRMGLPDLIRACGILAEAGRAFRLAIAGSGPSRDELEELTRALALEGRVRFLGRVPEERLPGLYRASDVFVLPTRSLEGFGMSTAEALASGLPVVATDVGANREVVGPVEGARLVPVGDPAALADALAPLIDDPAARRNAARAARAHAESRLGWDQHLDAFELAVERAASGRRR